jgi:glycosyltransferase involved in cell wall biosynthesis
LPVRPESAAPDAGPAFCTIVAKNYLAHARTLAASLLAHHPGAPLYVLLVDEVEGRFDPAAEPFRLVPLAALDLPAAREMCFRYELLELCTAVKPQFLRWAFARGHSQVVYLDPDVRVYRPLDGLLRALEASDVVLTPHLTHRVDDGRFPGEALMLLVGAYNLGFLALARSAAVDRLLDWWRERCARECTLEMRRGLFLDQKWLNLVPGLLDRVLVLRHPGYNLAHWNLNHRALSGSAEEPLVNGQPLYFLHGSSVDPLDPTRLACPQTRYDRLEGEPLAGLLRGYAAELLAAGYRDCRRWPYSYDRFRDGHPIHPEMRRLLREVPEGRFPDPFRTAGEGTFRAWATAAGARRTEVLAGQDAPQWQSGIEERARPAAPRAPCRDGATVIGYLRTESGMGELARSTVRALREVAYPVDTVGLRDPAHRHADHSLAGGASGRPLPFTIAALTAPDAARQRGTYALPPPGRYTIGYWPWELEAFPDDLDDPFAGFDEVWALSRFSAAAIAAASPVPVHAVWPALPALGPGPALPGAPVLDPAEYHFLFVCDFLSEAERKNPEGLLRAFRAAFRPSEPVRLTLKTFGGDRCRDDLRRILSAAEGLRVTVQDGTLARRDVIRLMASCDCYVSLHRAEGFGFTLVEAMALGRPVIATYYSGNTEYMTPWNSFPVPYRMVEVGARRGAYRAADLWAEPDHDAAVSALRRAYGEPELARQVGLRGQRDVRDLLSLVACGQRMVARLRTIGAAGTPRS